MRHVDARDAEALLELPDVDAHLLAELRVEVRERFVEEEDGRLHHDGARKRHPLLLPSGELAWLAFLQPLQPDEFHDAFGPLADLLLAQIFQLQAEGDVVAHVEVREDGVRLEDHRRVPLVRCDVVHPPLAEEDAPRSGVLEAREHPEERRLAAPRGAEEGDQLAVVDLQRDCVHRPEDAAGVVEAAEILGYGVDDYFHEPIPPESGLPPCRPRGRGRGAR